MNDEKSHSFDLSFEPLNADKFTDGAGRRMTRLSFGGGFSEPVEQSVDELFKLAENHPSAFVEHQFWHSIMPWLRNTEMEIISFWEAFNKPKAYSKRALVVQGAASANRTKEREVVGIAREIDGLRSGGENKDLLLSVFSNPDQRLELESQGLKMLGEWVLKAVVNDPKALRRLYDLLRLKQTQYPTKEADLFFALVQFVGENERLPTKKEVRHGSGMGDDVEEYKAANKAFNRLGLSGLPKG